MPDGFQPTPPDYGSEAPARPLPHSIEVEQALLGAILTSQAALESVSGFLRPEHFANALHRLIWESACGLVDTGKRATVPTLATYLADDADYREAGGSAYLAHLVASIITTANAEDYGRILVDLHQRREIIAAAQTAIDRAYALDVTGSAREVAAAVSVSLDAVLDGESHSDSGRTLGQAAAASIEAAQEAYRSGGALPGITTGLTDLDRKLGGLRPTNLVILAGRPSMGKTALAGGMALAAGRKASETDGRPVVLFSLEMSGPELTDRFLSSETGIDMQRLTAGQMNPAEWRDVMEARDRFSRIPLHIFEQDRTPAAIRARCRALARRHGGLSLVVIDYLQLMTCGGKGRENRVQELSEITRSLKALAKELNVPVLALSQLSRAVESRDDKRPMLSDLRDSGSIEQDADVVMFVYRDEYYLSREEPQQRAGETSEKHADRFAQWTARLAAAANVAEVIVAKLRQGQIGTVKTHFSGATVRFSDLARDWADTR